MQGDPKKNKSRPSTGEQTEDAISEHDAWPTFRADPARSGRSAANVPTALKPACETELGGRLSAPVAAFRDPAVQQQLLAQDTALRGESGGIRLTVDATTGETRAEYPLGSPPVFDGLIVANGRALLATTDGRIIAFESNAGQTSR